MQGLVQQASKVEQLMVASLYVTLFFHIYLLSVRNPQFNKPESIAPLWEITWDQEKKKISSLVFTITTMEHMVKFFQKGIFLIFFNLTFR